MENDQVDRPRRWLLKATGAVSAMGAAGCVGDDGQGDGSPDDDQAEECLERLSDSVPEGYETAESIDGVERDPDELETKEDSAYQCYPSRYALCANCRFLILEREGLTFRACAKVEGEVESQHWCALYQPTDRLDGFPGP